MQGGRRKRTKTSSFLTPGRSATTEMSLSDSRTSTLKLASGSVARSVCEAHAIKISARSAPLSLLHVLTVIEDKRAAGTARRD